MRRAPTHGQKEQGSELLFDTLALEQLTPHDVVQIQTALAPGPAASCGMAALPCASARLRQRSGAQHGALSPVPRHAPHGRHRQCAALPSALRRGARSAHVLRGVRGEAASSPAATAEAQAQAQAPLAAPADAAAADTVLYARAWRRDGRHRDFPESVCAPSMHHVSHTLCALRALSRALSPPTRPHHTACPRACAACFLLATWLAPKYPGPVSGTHAPLSLCPSWRCARPPASPSAAAARAATWPRWRSWAR